MLFELCLSEDDISLIEPGALSEGISEILRAHRFGHHLFVIDRKLGDWLNNNLPLNDADRAILRRIISSYAQFGNLRDRAHIYACIKGNDSPISCDKNVIYFPFSLISKPYLLDRTALITENSANDGKLIHEIISNVARRSGLGKVSFELVNGGGTTVEAVASNLIDDGRVMSIVLDSDHYMPKKEVPASIRRLNGLSQGKEWPFVFSSSLPCREIENLIPMNVVENLSCSVEKKKVFEALKKIASNEHTLHDSVRSGSFWRYFDTKKGLDKAKILELPPAEQEWLSARLKLCDSDGVGAISERIVQTLLADGRAMMEFVTEVVKPEWWHEFGTCFSPSLWAGVAAQRVRT